MGLEKTTTEDITISKYIKKEVKPTIFTIGLGILAGCTCYITNTDPLKELADLAYYISTHI